MIIFYFIIAILAGVSIVVARIFNAKLAEEIGLLESTGINYVTGFIFSLLILLISREYVQFSEIKSAQIPIWAYLGGLVSILVVLLSSHVTPKISAFYQTLFVFTGQIFIGVLIDFIISHQLSLGKIIGGILVLIGLTYNLWIDSKNLA